jgi:hypothetical protein
MCHRRGGRVTTTRRQNRLGEHTASVVIFNGESVAAVHLSFGYMS